MDQWGGKTWYRKSFDVPSQWSGKTVLVEFKDQIITSNVD